MNAVVPLFLIAPLVLVPLLPAAGILVVSFWLPAGPGGVTGPRRDPRVNDDISALGFALSVVIAWTLDRRAMATDPGRTHHAAGAPARRCAS